MVINVILSIIMNFFLTSEVLKNFYTASLSIGNGTQVLFWVC